MRIQHIINTFFLAATILAFPRHGLNHVDTNHTLDHRNAAHFGTHLQHSNILEVIVYPTTTITLMESATSSSEEGTNATVTVTVVQTLTSTIWEIMTINPTQSQAQNEPSSVTTLPTVTPSNTQCSGTGMDLSHDTSIIVCQNSSCVPDSSANSIAFHSTVTIEQPSIAQSINPGTIWTNTQSRPLSSSTFIPAPGLNINQSEISMSASSSIRTAMQVVSLEDENSPLASMNSIHATVPSLNTTSQSTHVVAVSSPSQETPNRPFPGTNAGSTLVVTPFLPPP